MPVQLDTISGHSLDELLISLNETIAFCSTRDTKDDLRIAFRSPGLNPRLPAPMGAGIVDWSIGREPVDRVIEARRRVLPQEVRNGHFAMRPAPGRLILFEAGIELFEGLGVEESRGFVDEADTPAWDTWVAWVVERQSSAAPRSYLVSWIPPTLVDLVHSAADLCTTNALRWLDDEPCLLRELLRERRVL